MRAQDPLTEVGLMLGGHKEDRFGDRTLEAVAGHFGVEPEVETQATCVDTRRQWRRAGNVWHIATIRSGLYAMGAPMRAVRRPFRKTPV